MWQASPKGVPAMLALESFIHECGFDERLIHLLKIRASQINGCACCFDVSICRRKTPGPMVRPLRSEPVAWTEEKGRRSGGPP